MSPQFVDFDADGRIDIVAGTFSGSPHVALAREDGFEQPKQILDAKGERILLNQFWNYETEQWETTQRCDEIGKSVPEGHATSAVAFDWDSDGDLDLLLGDYRSGRIYRRVNEGKPGEARYSGVNLAVMQGEKPLVVPAEIETIRLVDWDGDGAMDLVCGSVGETDGERPGVYWIRNGGKKGEPRFEAPRPLILAGEDVGERPVPYGGFYPDAADYDGDGDLDLIVGAKAHWSVPERELTSAEQTRLAEVREELGSLSASIQAFYERLERDSAAPDEKARKKQQAALLEERRPEIRALVARRDELNEELDGLTFGEKDGYRVWIYERVDA